MTLNTCANGHTRENYKLSFSDSQATFDTLYRERFTATNLPSLNGSDYLLLLLNVPSIVSHITCRDRCITSL